MTPLSPVILILLSVWLVLVVTAWLICIAAARADRARAAAPAGGRVTDHRSGPAGPASPQRDPVAPPEPASALLARRHD